MICQTWDRNYKREKKELQSECRSVNHTDYCKKNHVINSRTQPSEVFISSGWAETPGLMTPNVPALECGADCKAWLLQWRRKQTERGHQAEQTKILVRVRKNQNGGPTDWRIGACKNKTSFVTTFNHQEVFMQPPNFSMLTTTFNQAFLRRVIEKECVSMPQDEPTFTSLLSLSHTLLFATLESPLCNSVVRSQHSSLNERTTWSICWLRHFQIPYSPNCSIGAAWVPLAVT